MRLTRRDHSLIRDLALSHVLTRDQILGLGYFSSITRVNTRMRSLVSLGLVKGLRTPFHQQRLYVAGNKASEVVESRIERLLSSRAESPRFLQHALAVTNVRVALLKRGEGEWRFEQQLWRKTVSPRSFEVRPDGLFLGKSPIFIEVDMGHVAPAKFKEKLLGYRELALSGSCESLYGFSTFRLLTVTSGSRRARHLRRLLPQNAGFEFMTQTFEEVGAAPIAPWS